eukprot:TRINITY_DN171_c0_g1_i11.p1 TRINITY_DN171_c0_g1~~TRINITY_DN171_c0_g1_i11.p1  ORF type:complete len:157 (-),score=13.86 TRINITY_DN171_c0_g1_i11:726-1196(-)
MSTNPKYTRKELRDYKTSKAKKFKGVTKRGEKYYQGVREIIPAEDMKEFLVEYYDNPETGYCGRDRLYAKIAEKYAGISRRDVASFLQNLETAQVHQQPKNVKISRPVVTRKPMAAWACDLTWLSKTSIESNVSVEKDSQIVFTCLTRLQEQYLRL